ncbi:MAG TPA: hypothetical protein VGG44_05130 [Tepidisphaeraceae bacterium]|jgi:hypothetical protein
MTSPAPQETDILCENCGYMLNGLPASGRCPECGSEIDLSVSEQLRKPPIWEDIGDSRPKWLRFSLTTAQIIFRPTRFFRGSTSRGPIEPAQSFARIHYLISSILIGVAAWAHWDWYERAVIRVTPPAWEGPVLFLALPVGTYLAITLTIRLAARLTAWEAAYRGYRLPHGVVLRALYYHAAHFLPVALLALATCGGYNLVQRTGQLLMTTDTAYLYVLCGEVVVAAGYLFNTYWIGMRNLMYANR